MAIWATIGRLFGAGGGTKALETTLRAIDGLHTSAEEKGSLRSSVVSSFVEAQSRVIAQEAAVGGIAAVWRPILMLMFGTIILWATVAETFGYPAPKVTLNPELWGLLKLGIGGYIGGRSLEKVIHMVSPLKRKQRDRS